MKIKRFQDFSINESFGISKELNNFIRSKSLDWSEFEDSLWDIKDDSDFEIKKSCELVDENDHTINIELERDKQYKLLYKLSIQSRQMCTDPRIVEELKSELSDCKTPEDIQKTMVNHR